jgi:hypothetical protein
VYVCARRCKRGGLTTYGPFRHARCPFALARPGSCIIVAFFGLDALGFRVLGLRMHISARCPSMIASCPSLCPSLYCDALLCITTNVSCHYVIHRLYPSTLLRVTVPRYSIFTTTSYSYAGETFPKTTKNILFQHTFSIKIQHLKSGTNSIRFCTSSTFRVLVILMASLIGLS